MLKNLAQGPSRVGRAETVSKVEKVADVSSSVQVCGEACSLAVECCEFCANEELLEEKSHLGTWGNERVV